MCRTISRSHEAILVFLVPCKDRADIPTWSCAINQYKPINISELWSHIFCIAYRCGARAIDYCNYHATRKGEEKEVMPQRTPHFKQINAVDKGKVPLEGGFSIVSGWLFYTVAFFIIADIRYCYFAEDWCMGFHAILSYLGWTTSKSPIHHRWRLIALLSSWATAKKKYNSSFCLA